MSERVTLPLKQFKLNEDLLQSGLYCYQTSIVFAGSETDLQIFLSDKQQDSLENHIEKIENQVYWLQTNMDYVEGEIRQSHLIELKNDNWWRKVRKK